jgi:subfamily B ATP-binding cassette protein MsbA
VAEGDSQDGKPEDAASKKKRLKPQAVWREARDLVLARKGRLGLGLLLIGTSRLAGLVLPASSKLLIDDIIGRGESEILSRLAAVVGVTLEGPADLLVALAVAAGIATLIQSATSFALVLLLGVTAQRSITDLRKKVEQHVIRLPVSFFDSTKSGELISRVMTDAEGIRNLVGSGLVQLAGGLLTAGVALLVLLYLNWTLTLSVLVGLLAFGAGMAVFFKRLRPIFRERGKLNAEVTGRLGESLGGVRLVKAYTAERREDLVFAKGAHRLLKNVTRSMLGVAQVTAFTNLLVGALGLLIAIFGGRSILAGTMTLGDLVMYLLFTGMVAAPLVQIASIGTQITEAFAGLDRLREIMGLATEDALDQSRARLDGVRGDIAFEDVSFEYDAGIPVLKKVSFHAPAGTTTALVGPSGSGKSTLIGLAMAFMRPKAGRITVDGRDLDGLRLKDYRSHLGVVFQDNFLFDGTVAENIAYGRPGASRAELEHAGAIAHCDEFVRGFPKGYDTVVGERGVKLSGGQRQRVAIARAILADPRILILDEATSSLDSESEAFIQDGLKRLRTGRTTFVIAHRLSTIRSADQILVLAGGEIVERGTHAELIALGGRYRQLHDRQYQFEADRFINPGEDFTPEQEKVVPEEREAVGLPSGRGL